MVEYFTEGIVLKRSMRGEYDGNIILYTKDLGKISTFAKSIRKITSKLSGHMIPGNIVKTRVVEKNNIQAIDALGEKSKCSTKELLHFLHFLDTVVPFGEPDIPLWYAIRQIIEKCSFTPKTYSQLLEILGFSEGDGLCHMCKRNEIAYFSMTDIIFLCGSCKLQTGNIEEDEIIRVR